MQQAETYNILVFHPIGFSYGSTEKLMRLMSKILSRDFNVFFAAGGEIEEAEKRSLEEAGVKIIYLSYNSIRAREPHNLIGMSPSIQEILHKYNITCVFTNVFAHYQFPINRIPASIPVVLISPFGHYATNGNVVLAYVSGKGNTERVKSRGVKNVKILFNPLADFPMEVWQKAPVKELVVFGRIGRGDNSIYDSIALQAFKKLETKYPGQVKYIVVNPPPLWKKQAEELLVKNMEFRGSINESQLAEFYRDIDVFAHARKDGETVGMAIAEAMLAGNPILTHRSHHHNDHFDILDSSYARWSEADDVEKYFENMEWMVKNRNQIRPMGQLARARALEIFGLEKQSARIIADFKEACKHYYGHTFYGRVKGCLILYWENLKALPFLAGKFLTYKFPSLYKKIRRFYYA